MRICIIGVTGSLGQRLIKFYTELGWTVTGVSRDSIRQAQLKSKYPNAHFHLTDICDYHGIREAIYGSDFVVNAAALKHATLGESDPNEYIRVNLLGAQNVAQASLDENVKTSLLISSDKAVSPINTYGKTKALAEDVYRSYGYRSLRYGNVVESRGGFVEVWRNIINYRGTITVRKPSPTRFYLDFNTAVHLVHDALHVDMRDGGGVYIPANLEAFSLTGIANYLKNMREVDVEFEHLVAGEKQHEILLAPQEQGRYLKDGTGYESELLCEVWKGYRGELQHHNFYSMHAPQIDPEEFLRMVNL